MGISKNTVKAALASDQPPKYERRLQGSIVDEVEQRIREPLQAYPRMPATVIAERIGWTRSIPVLSARVAELRPVYLPPIELPVWSLGLKLVRYSTVPSRIAGNSVASADSRL